MQGLYDKKHEIKENFYKAKLEFEIEADEMSHIEWMMR